MIKTNLKCLVVFILSLVSVGASAQEITCDAFCLTDVRMDSSAPNILYVTLFFAGDNDDFINYPWISEVINEQGDTIGVGTWNFFGQFGNTSNDYPVTVEFDSIPDNFNATMIFHYDTSVCLLSFPCSNTGTENANENDHVRIYPNPSPGLIHIDSPGKWDNESWVLHLVDLQGHLVVETQLNEESTIDLSFLNKGMYFLLMKGNKGWQSVVLVKN